MTNLIWRGFITSIAIRIIGNGGYAMEMMEAQEFSRCRLGSEWKCSLTGVGLVRHRVSLIQEDFI